MDTRNIPDLLDDWALGIALDESDCAGYEVVVTFDHDYEYHLLVREYGFDDRSWRIDKGYALWFIGADNPPILVARWDTKRAPWVEAATHVDSWRALCREVWGG